jgi:hypothetical protein
MVFARMLKQRDYLCFTVVINQSEGFVLPHLGQWSSHFSCRVYFLMMFLAFECLFVDYFEKKSVELIESSQAARRLPCRYLVTAIGFRNILQSYVRNNSLHYSVFHFYWMWGTKVQIYKRFSNDLHSISNDVVNILTNISVYGLNVALASRLK